VLRWLYHVLLATDPIGDPYTPVSLVREGFVHCSFVDVVAASARLYFPPDVRLQVLQIDPRGLDVRVVATPRGPMPHVHQAIPRERIRRVLSLDQLGDAPDRLTPPDDGAG
jgi:uncharacterized protein (DUF952 family)